MSSWNSNADRRKFLQLGAAGLIGSQAMAWNDAVVLGQERQMETRQATGVKIGEVTDTSAMIWMRITANAAHNAMGTLIRQNQPLPANQSIADLRGACPGARGRVRVRYSTNENLANATETEWTSVNAAHDYTHRITLTNLRPNTVYYFAAETMGPGADAIHAPLRGRFKTAPVADEYADVLFTVITGQAYKDLDHADGYNIYPVMQRMQPNFLVPTGDTVYFDNDGVLANTVDMARHHWHRMYGLPRHIEFHRNIPAYWEKDDHDCYHDDCWPGMRVRRMDPLTFAQGQGIFREQVPMSRLPYRTFRWGRGLQVWLVEGRDYRSSNRLPDGPNKTIWGAEQKRWLKQSLRQSNATFKVLISPTPIVGPDRPNKRDNHANAAFQTEGDEMRQWFQQNLPERFVICCGDRHWQYHSIHPQTRVHEFSCGPVSNQHSGGSPGRNQQYHQFHRVRGGFLSVGFSRQGNDNRLTLRLHNVEGGVEYEYVLRG